MEKRERESERATQLEYKPCAVRTSRGKISGSLLHQPFPVRSVNVYNKVKYITAGGGGALLYESETFMNVVITLCPAWPFEHRP